MHRLQVMIPGEDYAWLKQKAQAEGKSIGQVVREAIRRFRKHVAAEELPPLEEDPFWELVGAFQGPPPHDASIRHDEILYGEGK